ncbi:LysR family transcriptional regulator [Arenicella xantha]|uniref:DNA-binding transcriptional LysR family regulator n=1 Tax=Arenicella xantha TaxID=644221 RepID=A0A395JH32_9GAMM|nr:LysR family transcriptional regulator [Arenicella xantha]RBP49267.1 DNA-binding transcriptional LysR family regulator [Arenicella xantha]
MQDPLSRIDLNLLVSFQVLIQEKNVTRAAERLFVTQPAMSKTLNRLRNLLEDELFVRSSHGLTPTPKTLELERPVNDILSQLTELMVSNQEFDPANTAATISLATLGTSASVGMPAFINKLRQHAPKVMLLSQNIDAKWEDRLRSGSLDFAIVAKKRFSDDFVTHKLMNIKPVLYMRNDHPLANVNQITLEQRREYQHMAVYFPNFETTRDDMKKLFASFGILSNVPFLTTNLMVCLETLRETDMLMIASDRLMESSLISENFVSKPLDDLINLKIDALSLVQHVRTKNSPLHQYLTRLIVESFKET